MSILKSQNQYPIAVDKIDPKVRELAEKLCIYLKQCELEYQIFGHSNSDMDFTIWINFPGSSCSYSRLRVLHNNKHPNECIEHIEALLSMKLKGITFISPYLAITLPESGYIECGLGPNTQNLIFLLRYLNKKLPFSDTSDYDIYLQYQENIKDKFILELSSPSIYFNNLIWLRNDIGGHQNSFIQRATLKIHSKDKILTVKEAYDILSNIGNAFLFEQDVLYGVPMYLLTENMLNINTGIFGSSKNSKFITRFSKSYNESSLSSYWYGRTAIDKPLLQFFSYYQSIEYFLPKEEIQNINGKTKKLNEEERFIKLINDNVDSKDLFEYLKGDVHRRYFSNPELLQSCKIDIEENNLNIVEEAAKRIYRIRCKIVHTKSDYLGSEGEPIFPFSPEAKELRLDTDLVKYVAQKILLSS